jgi:hypothetical protein
LGLATTIKRIQGGPVKTPDANDAGVVGAHVELTPPCHQSSEIDFDGGIANLQSIFHADSQCGIRPVEI